MAFRHLRTLAWALFLGLAGAVLVLRLRAPGHPLAGRLTLALMALLFLRLILMTLEWQRGDLPGTRLILPTVIFAEGLALVAPSANPWFLRVRLLTALVLEVLLLVLAARALRRAPVEGQWPEDRLAAAFAAFLPPRIARLAALELVMLGTALHFLFGGFRRAAPEGFSLHREAALGSFLPVLPLLIPGDLLLIHVLARHLAPWLRWALHLSTVYAVLWLFGLYASLKARPHRLRGNFLDLHVGLVKSVTLRRDQIRSLAPLPEFDDDWARHRYMQGVHRLVTPGPAVIELTLAEAVPMVGLTGPGSRLYSRVAVAVDDPRAFAAALGFA